MQTENLVALVDQQAGKVGAVLAGDAGNECVFRAANKTYR